MGAFLLRLFLAGLFVFAGLVHLGDPVLFLPIMPPGIPWPMGCILVSGVFEILGGVGLLVPVAGIRRWAGVGLVLLLIAVFPANIYMAAAHVQVHGVPSQPWMAWARLALQPVLIAAVWWAAEVGFTRRRGDRGGRRER
ncbi:MAG TPA: hypothetical protein VHY09_11570 [Candidatus Methylacidiphilales bacterium]|jgi:uncharacterized membrane protein|nr:hypothetical protein [Candidatus Methylacidiphilales bacterium]